ncbi:MULTISPECIES: lysozyme inhibitor LprI family protein [unclassified Bradyrhizobium]|nr:MULTISPECIES: lysozyme inhibitor LprI family protein [unclassified Bradyrhizobium]
MSCSSQANALDCARASTAVERAICVDPGLKAADAKLADQYFSMLNRTKMMAEITGRDSTHDRLLASQRAFVSLREKECGAASQDDIRRCIADQTAKRAVELDRLARYEAGDDENELAARDYKIGSETITVTSDPNEPDQRSMRHKGVELLSGESLHVWDVWKAPGVTAVLVEAYDGGTDQCRSVYIVETRPPHSMKAIDLDKGCAYGPRWHVGRTATGFAFETDAQPLQDGAIVEWAAATGVVGKRPTRFVPNPDLTMEGLLRLDKAEYRDPLTTAEFFYAVQTLPGADRTRALQALWNIGDSCDCNSDDRLNLYGAQIETDLAAYSTCGWYLRGSVVRCQDTDALAVWDRKTRKAYVAVDDHVVGGGHTNSPNVRFYPARELWPPRAAAKLGTWMTGAIWDSKRGSGN